MPCFSTSCLFVLLASSAPAPLAAVAPPPGAPAQAEPSFDELLAGAGSDTAELWKLHEACRAKQQYSESRRALKRIIEVDPDHAQAREALGHSRYDGQWFESSYKLAEYKRAEEERMRTEKGLVRLGEEWVPEKDAPFLRMGWSKGSDGRWVGPVERARREEAERLSAKGWKQQTDLAWVSPEDQAKWQEGKWKVGDAWMTVEEANAVHSKLGQAWSWPTQYFVLQSTLDNEGLAWAAWWADQTWRDLVRAYGVQPKSKPVVTVLNGTAQYNSAAQGDQAAGRPPAESNGWSSCHYAFVGEAWFDASRADPQNLAATVEYVGGGISYWDKNDASLAPFGQHAVRFAAGLSYAEAIDPSWDAVSRFVSNPAPQGQVAGFWAEKKLPLWWRYGVASYVDRFFRDPQPAEGFGEWWARDWALDNVRRQGGLRPLAENFAFRLDPNDQAGSSKLISEAGMLVSFVLDGESKPVRDAHAAFKAALRSGEGVAEAMAALQQAILEHDEALHYHVRM
jgi:hypothetical protein